MVKQTLCAAIESAMQVTSTWQTRVGDEALAELTALREKFHAGHMGSRPYLLARLAIDIGKARGWKLPSEKVIAAWLRTKD